MTAYHPIAALQEFDAAPDRTSRWYLFLVGLTLVSGTVVLVEPAPYDIAMLLLLVAGVLLNKFSFVVIHRIPILLLLGFFVANVVSFSAVTDFPRAFGYVSISLYLALSWLCFTGVSCANGHDGIRVLINGYTLAGYCTALLNVLAFFRWIPYQNIFLRYGRAQGFFKDPNVYGPYLVLVLLFGFASLQRRRVLSLGFILGLGLCVVTALGIFLSFSRAAWTNCAVSIIVFLGLQFAYGLITRSISAGMLCSVLALPLLAGGIAMVALSAGSGFEKLLMDRLGNNGLKNYDAMRFYTQGRALETSRQQPLGIGPGQSEVMFHYSTHNMYIRVLVECGMFGFAAFYSFVIASFLRAVKMALTLREKISRDLFAVVAAGLFGLFINGLVIDTIHWRHFWLLLALAWWVPQAVRSRTIASGHPSLEEAVSLT
jgi:O-antigen ligase